MFIDTTSCSNASHEQRILSLDLCGSSCKKVRHHVLSALRCKVIHVHTDCLPALSADRARPLARWEYFGGAGWERTLRRGATTARASRRFTSPSSRSDTSRFGLKVSQALGEFCLVVPLSRARARSLAQLVLDQRSIHGDGCCGLACKNLDCS